MKQFLIFIAAFMLVFTAYGQRRSAVMFNPTNGVLLSPTNLFAANSNALNAVVASGSSFANLTEDADSVDVSTNLNVSGTITGNGSGVTNIPGSSITGQITLDADMNAGGNSITNIGTMSVSNLTATTVSGDGSGLTNVYDGHVIRIDSDGARENYYEPGALEAAVLDHAAGDVLQVFGLCTLSNAIILTNATLMGMGNAVIVSWVDSADGCAIVPYDGTLLQNFSIWSGWRYEYGELTNTVQLVGTKGSSGQPAITNAVARNLSIYGDKDGWYVAHTLPCTATIEFSLLDADYDPGILYAPGTNTLNFCTLKAPDRIFPVSYSGGVVHLNNCTFEFGSSSAAGSIAIPVTVTGGKVYITGGKFLNLATNTGCFAAGFPNVVGGDGIHITGTEFVNEGNSDFGVLRVNYAGAEAYVSSSTFSQTISDPFFSSSKGQILVWGGDADASTFGANTSGGASNLFLKSTQAAPSDTATPDAWVDMYIGTTKYKMPLYTP